MNRQNVEIIQTFNAPVEEIFKLLTDHKTFGKIVHAKIKRVVDSNGKNKNGEGSVRRISIFPLISFEESVIAFEPNHLMAYTITKGSPIKNHKGRMEFYDEKGKTRLKYIIEFQPKLPFLFLGSILNKVIKKPIKEGLSKLAEKYDTE